ncbi:MAG TPA: aminoglycoside phosphotransferase family protein [Aggregatilineaceae bacterium]|nr:aminoglycoside phosphotransferase family protein [Aggregatilineaceae bacterium]
MLDRILVERYGLADVRLSPAPHGFVAETYYVDSASGRYFAKFVKPSLGAVTIAPSLPLLRELKQLGVDQITYPIPTTDGQLSVPLGGALFILFNCVAGDWVFDYPFEPYIRLLAEIHHLSDRIQSPLLRETYELAFMDDLRAYCKRLWTGAFDQEQEKALATWAVDCRDDLLRTMHVAKETIKQLQSSEHVFVLTHGDAPGNIMYDGKQIALVDWDMVMFAPRERDTWFHRHDARFLPLYRQFVPGYDFDPTAYRFYLYKRYLEDVLGFFEKILSPHSSDEVKADNYRQLIQDCDGWLRPLMEQERAEN